MKNVRNKRAKLPTAFSCTTSSIGTTTNNTNLHLVHVMTCGEGPNPGTTMTVVLLAGGAWAGAEGNVAS